MYAMIALAVILIGWALISARARRYSVTAPIALLIAGAVLAGGDNPVAPIDIDNGTIRVVLQVTLALVLYCDATGMHPTSVRAPALPARLLVIGFPLAVVAGYLVGLAIFPSADPWVLALIASALATTDSALAAPAVHDRRVPHDLRTALNVESGFNDGLATPLVLFFLAAAVSTHPGGTGSVLGTALVELVIAIAIGAVLGAAASWLLRHSRLHRDGTPRSSRIAYLAIAPLAFEVTHVAHGNGIVAAFVAGMAVRAVDRELPDDRLMLAQDTELVLSALVWFTFGAFLPQTIANDLDWRVVLFAVLILTAGRMIPVAISLLGTRSSRRDVLFLGWVGPRGLACIIFALIALEQLTGTSASLVVATVMATVVLSVLAHGLSAGTIAHRWPRDVSQGPRPGN